METIIGIIGIFALFFVVLCAFWLNARHRTSEEIEVEDEEQITQISEWHEEKERRVKQRSKD